MGKYFKIDYDKKIIELFYDVEKFLFDLNEGDIGDFWHSFTTKDGVTKDINFYQEDATIKPSMSIYDLDEDGYINTTYEEVIDCTNIQGNPQNYFNLN